MVDVGANRLLCQTSGGWSLVESPSTASSGLLCASYQDVSAQCVFDFGDDVSPSDLKAVAEKVEYDASVGGLACGFHVFCEVDRDPLHFVANNAIVLQQTRATLIRSAPQ